MLARSKGLGIGQLGSRCCLRRRRRFGLSGCISRRSRLRCRFRRSGRRGLGWCRCRFLGWCRCRFLGWCWCRFLGWCRGRFLSWCRCRFLGWCRCRFNGWCRCRFNGRRRCHFFGWCWCRFNGRCRRCVDLGLDVEAPHKPTDDTKHDNIKENSDRRIHWTGPSTQ